MELVKNIFFNTDRLVEDSVVKLSYTGVFFQNNADCVYIHYGFGNEWENLNEIKMEKTELGFQAEIKLIGCEPLNMCFRTDKGQWDNNDGSNFSFDIEPKSVAMVAIDNGELTYPRKLRKTYLWSKKIKLAVYKILRYFPKLVSGNYKKKRVIEN